MQTSEILELAKLASIEIDDDEIASIRGALAEIMSLIDQLQQAPADSLEPLAHPLDVKQALRPDAVIEDGRREEIQKGAPEVQDGFYVVPPVID